MAFKNKFHERLQIRLKSAYLRITLTRFTAAFFLFALLYCLVQGVINGMLFSVDARSMSLLTAITEKANVPIHTEFTWLRGSPGNRELYMCRNIPLDLRGGPVPCRSIFNNTDMLDRGSYPPALAMTWNELSSVVISVVPTPNTNTTFRSVKTVELVYNQNSTSTILTPQCSRVLTYARQIMMNSKREDLTIIAIQFWLFAISFIAVTYDSIPHMIAVLIARALTTTWSAYAVWHTTSVKSRFSDLFINQGTACGVDFGFGEYFADRIHYEIPDLVLNVTALFIFSYLSLNLLKMYNSQTFQRVGVSSHIIRIYRFFMAKLVCVQLCVFVLIAATSLWIDQLYNSAVTVMAVHAPLYKVLFWLTISLMVPWLIAGWLAVRREMRILMLIYGIITFVFIVFWCGMFSSRIYRWTYMTWPFMASMTNASLGLLVASLVLGGVCWFNFNKGLRHYLYVEDQLASMDFEAEVFPHSPNLKEGHKPDAECYVIQRFHSEDGPKHASMDSVSTV